MDLPTRLDGISLPAEPDALAAEVRACLGGGPPLAAGLPPGLAANQSGLWVAQLLRRLAEGSARGTVMTAVQDAVADPTLREAALNALRWAPSGDAGAELARSLRAAPDDARERRLGQAVEQLLLQVAAGKLHAPALVEAAFDALARGVAVPELVFMLAAIDPPRVATAGRALIGRSPKAIEYLASALEDHPGLLGPLFRHVVADGALPPDQLVGPSAGRLLSEAAIEIARAALA